MAAVQEVHPSISRSPIALDGDDLATVCVLCSHNCGLRMDVRDGRITAIRADDRNPITQGYICNKGVTCDKYAHHEQRTEHPLRRDLDGGFERIGWDTAIDEIAAKLSSIRDRFGPRAIALCGIGGQANHMDGAYGTSFLRAIGSRRWFNAYAQEKTQHHLLDHWMFDASPALFFHPDTENVEFLLVMGTNPRISNRGHNPTETFKGLSKRGDCKVVVADPRETETTRGADVHLRVEPGGDVYLLLGMAATIVQNELYDSEFVTAKTEGFKDVRDVLSRVNVAEMAARAGLSETELRGTAEEFANASGSGIFFDLGLEMTPFSTLLSYLIRLNLAMTGNVGRAGGQIFLEGFTPPSLSEGRNREPERALASGIQAIRALGNFEMFSPSLLPEEVMVDHPERIRALIVEASNPLLSFSDTQAWLEAFAELDLLVVIEPAMTETARRADYVLPVPCGYEKWEIALFPKRHPQIDVQLRPPILPAPADTLPEPEIYARLVESMHVLDPLPDDLAEAGREPGAEARAAFLMLAMSRLADPAARGINGESQLLFWAYRAIGHHFESPALVAVWAQCQTNVMERLDSVLRSLGPEWAEKSPLEIGEEMFARIIAHPEGVEVARVADDVGLEDYVGYADKKVRLAPGPMIAEMERAIATDHKEVDPDYPFVMAAGLRTRWTANTIQRDPSWRKGNGPHCALNVSVEDAERLGLGKGDRVRVETRRGSLELPAAIDKKLRAGHVWMPNGFGVQFAKTLETPTQIQGANCNQLTDVADRDPITGCPHHRYVRVKLTRLESAVAAAGRGSVL